MVYIVGIGPGSREYILPKAVDTMEKSDIVIGFERAISSLDFIKTEKIRIKSLGTVLQFIEENTDKNISVAASGDPCFYGITDYLKRNYPGNIEVIPGISSFQYLAAKLNKPWQGSFLGSLHGRSGEFIERVCSNKLSIWLTDKSNTPEKLCRDLIANGVKAKIYVGENLSYEDENIIEGMPEQFVERNFSELCIVIIEQIG